MRRCRHIADPIKAISAYVDTSALLDAAVPDQMNSLSTFVHDWKRTNAIWKTTANSAVMPNIRCVLYVPPNPNVFVSHFIRADATNATTIAATATSPVT